MAEHKEGLHKKVSSIFNGVPIPESNGALQVPQQPAADSAGDESTKPVHKNPEPPAAAFTAPPPEQTQTDTPPPKKPLSNTPLKTYATSTGKKQVQLQLQQLWEKIKEKLFTPEPGVSPSKQIATVVMIPVLFIIMIVVFTKLLRKPSTKKPAPDVSQTAVAVAASDKKTEWQIPEPYPTGLRDPMQFGSTTTAAANAAGLIVKGITYNEESPLALVGSQIIREGDKISGVTVIKINRDSVEFEINGERQVQKVQR
ncbi:MAG: hypothetical protein ACYS1A_05950 [Planctomycetota bacterium]|jgi:hypothetical protein